MNRGDISVILPEQPHALFQYENVEANYINIVFNLEYLHSQGTTNYLYDKYIAPFVRGERSLDPYIPCRSLINAELFPYINELFNCRHEKLHRRRITHHFRSYSHHAHGLQKER